MTTTRTSRPMPDEPRPVILSGKPVGRPNSVVLSGKTSGTQDVASSRRDLGGEAASARGETCTSPDPRPAIACIGPVTAQTARELGLRVDVVAREYTVEGLRKVLQ